MLLLPFSVSCGSLSEETPVGKRNFLKREFGLAPNCVSGGPKSSSLEFEVSGAVVEDASSWPSMDTSEFAVERGREEISFDGSWSDLVAGGFFGDSLSNQTTKTKTRIKIEKSLAIIQLRRL